MCVNPDHHWTIKGKQIWTVCLLRSEVAGNRKLIWKICARDSIFELPKQVRGYRCADLLGYQRSRKKAHLNYWLKNCSDLNGQNGEEPPPAHEITIDWTNKRRAEEAHQKGGKTCRLIDPRFALVKSVVEEIGSAGRPSAVVGPRVEQSVKYSN